MTARRAVSASAWRWCASSSRCTAAKSPCTATGVGQGSEFIVRLPLLDSAAAQPLGTRGAHGRRDAGRVIASWSPTTIRTRSKAWRCCSNATATRCGRPRTAQRRCELAAKCQPDLALLDIGMPVLDGYEAARRIRSEPWGKRMMLVALSGWGQSADVQRSRDSGFDTHLVKPASFDALAQLLSRVPSGGK